MRHVIVCPVFFLFFGLGLSGCMPQAPKVSYPHPQTLPPVESPAERPAPAVTVVPERPPGVAVEKPAGATQGAIQPEIALVPETGGVPAVAQPTVREEKRKLDYIEQRLAAYERKFQQLLERREMETGQVPGRLDQTTWYECITRFDKLLSGYTGLQDRIKQGGGVAAGPDLEDLLQQDIDFLESDCEKQAVGGSVAGGPEGPVAGRMEQARAEAETTIDHQFKAGQYREAIGTYRALTETYPEVKTSLAASRQYGLSLLYSGDNEAAAAFFNQLLPGAVTGADTTMPWELQRLAADLQLANGNLSAAKKLYDSLVAASEPFDAEINWANMQLALLASVDNNRQMSDYRDLLQDYLLFERKGQGGRALLSKADNLSQAYPDTKVADSAIQIKAMVKKRLWERIDEQIAKARQLRGEKEFQQAAALLKELLTADLPDEMREHVQRTREEVLTAEEQEQQTQKMQLEQSLATQWASAKSLLDSQRYDEAIAGFQALEDTDYDAEARQKVAEAANLAAAAKRQEAAALFIKAVKTDDRERKKEFLLNSRQLLQEILTKYPGADLIDKVAQNLQVVEQHIREFDPQLLEEQGVAQPANSAEENENQPGWEKPASQGNNTM